MIKRIFLAFVFCAFSFNAIAQTKVVEVRAGQHEDKTRVVIEVDKPTKPRNVFTLPSPNRVVADFDVLDVEPELSKVKQPPKSVVTDIRHGIFNSERSRFVMDVKSPVKVRYFTLPPNKWSKHRVVLDIYPVHPSEIQPETTEVKKPVPKEKLENMPQVVAGAKKPDEPVVIVIDPGHGGQDPGAVSRNKNYEKHVVLRVAKKLKAELEKQPNIKVYLTRTNDKYIRLRERVKKAQALKADLFLSIHADAHNDRRVKGGSVYVLSERSSDREAARLAREANRSDFVAGMHLKEEAPDVRNILIDLTQRETMNQSAVLGQKILDELSRVVPLRKSKIQFAGFMVLKAPEIPSVLVELSYISNRNDEKNLMSPTMQTKMARGIADGVEKYITRYLKK